MAIGELFGNLKNKVRSMYNNFFYDGSEAPVGQMQEDEYAGQEQSYAQQPQGGWQQQYQYSQAQPYQAGYQQPYGYQQVSYQQTAYQQPQPQAQQSAYQQPQQGRNRRAQQRQAENNVVDFGAYQQQSQTQNYYGQTGAVYQQPQPQQSQASPQEGEQSAPGLMSARVVNARNMSDCRRAISVLRDGDAVVVVMETVNDPAEMRRMVDTLSGACYSLTATITKVARAGVYLLAPQALAVFTDQATNMMNMTPARAQARPYQQGYAPRPNGNYQPQQNAPQAQNPYPGQQEFMRRAPMPEEAPQRFYQRPLSANGAVPSFSTQPAGYGYGPDENAAAEQ